MRALGEERHSVLSDEFAVSNPKARWQSFQVRNSVRPMHLFGHDVDDDCCFEPQVTGIWVPNRLLGVQRHTIACSAVINSTREAKAICSLNHPQSASCTDVGSQDGVDGAPGRQNTGRHREPDRPALASRKSEADEFTAAQGEAPVENMLYPATDAQGGDAGWAKPRVHEPLQHPPTLFR
jgi:hypothetical protein